MPLYEYQCGRCGRFEIIQKFSDSPLAACPKCGSEVQKLLSAPAIHFKGTGWYVTDYAKKSSGPAGGDGGSGDKASTSDAGGAKTSAPAKTTAKDTPAGGSGSSK